MLTKYTDEFTQTAVRLGHQPGVQVKTVAPSLTMHPFILATWRNDVRDGIIRGRTVNAPSSDCAREIVQLKRLTQHEAELQDQHEVPNRTIRLRSVQRARRCLSSFVYDRVTLRAVYRVSSLRFVCSYAVWVIAIVT
jgi:transposase